jgi:hypothetical protein
LDKQNRIKELFIKWDIMEEINRKAIKTIPPKPLIFKTEKK